MGIAVTRDLWPVTRDLRVVFTWPIAAGEVVPPHPGRLQT